MKLTDLPIDRPVGTIMLLVSLMVLGWVAIFKLPLDFMPEVAEPGIFVEISYPGSHPLENLKEVVEPIEAELATITDIRGIYTEAGAGRSEIWTNFSWDVPIELKKMEVREAIDRAKPNLPDDIGQISIGGNRWGGPGGGAVLEGRISAARSLNESWQLLDKRIRRPLERIKGVARVDLGGVAAPQIWIELDLNACRRHHISPQDISQAIRSSNLELDLGTIQDGHLSYNIRTLSGFTAPEDIADLLVSIRLNDPTQPTQWVKLSDVAKVDVREGHIDYGRHLDGEFAISIDVYKEPTANTVETVDRLLERIDVIKADPELEGITLLVWNNAGEEIVNSINSLRDAGIFGGLLAIAILLFFLRRLDTTVIVAVAIPFSLIVTCGAMYLLGSVFNVLTMLGLMLGVGMLVDNAVVVIENIYRKQSMGMPSKEAARLGSREVAMAVMASTATSVIVWAWLFVVERSHMSIYLSSVALTICLAVGCSLLISLTFIPLAAARSKAKGSLKAGFLMTKLVPAYRRMLRWTLRHRAITLFILLSTAASAAIPIQKIEKRGEPSQRDEYVTVRFQVADPVDLPTLESHVITVEEVIFPHQERLEISNIYAFFSENGFAMLRLYVPTENANEKDIAHLKDEVMALLPDIPGVTLTLSERQWWRNNDKGNRVSVNLNGEDPEFLRHTATLLEEEFRNLEDVKEVYGPSLRGRKEAQVHINTERAHALGLRPKDIADTVAFTFRGRNLTRYQNEDGEMNMFMTLSEDLKPGLAGLQDLVITGENGQNIPLGSVAEVIVTRTDDEIDREDRQTTSRIAVEFNQDILKEEGERRVTAVMDGFRLPDGYSWDFGQWRRRNEQGLDTMLHGVLLSLAGVILLMAALFESFTQPLAIIITLPLAFFGGFWALWLGGYDLDVVGFMGVIILIGIVVNNGIVMVDHVNQLRDQGMDRVEALIQGCGDRLRPILMTAITTIFGLVPLGFSQFTIADAYVDALAVVVIGGLTTSTIFTLLALPVWYATLEDVGAVLSKALPRRVSKGPLNTDAPTEALQEM